MAKSMQRPSVLAVLLLVCAACTNQHSNAGRNSVSAVGSLPRSTPGARSTPAPTGRRRGRGPIPAQPVRQPWHATAIGGPAAGDDILTSYAGSLYTVAGVSGDSAVDVRRVDPVTSTVLAQVRHLSLARPAVPIEGTIWAVRYEPADHTDELVGLDSRTLAVAATMPTTKAPLGLQIIGSVPTLHRLYLLNGRTVLVIDTARGHITTRYRLPGGDLNAVVDSTGTHLYATSVGNSTPERMTVRDAQTGQPLGLATFRDSNDEEFAPIAASPGGVWIFGGSGMTGTDWFHPLADLSRNVGPAGPAGGGWTTTVSIYRHTAWMGSTGHIACLNPITGTARAQATLSPRHSDTANINTITEVGHILVANLLTPSHDTLVRLTPPAACTP